MSTAVPPSPRLDRTGALSPRRKPASSTSRDGAEAALVLEVVRDDDLVDGERVAGLRAVAGRHRGLLAGHAAVRATTLQRSRRSRGASARRRRPRRRPLARSPRPGRISAGTSGQLERDAAQLRDRVAEAVGATALAQVLQLREEVHPVRAVDQRGGEQHRDRGAVAVHQPLLQRCRLAPGDHAVVQVDRDRPIVGVRSGPARSARPDRPGS